MGWDWAGANPGPASCGIPASCGLGRAVNPDLGATASSWHRRSRRSLRPRPTAIFAANDATAIGCLTALRELGLRVPEDVSLVGFDDIPIARYLSPPLTTVRVPIAELGRRGFTPDYVFRETKRSVASANGRTKIYTGVGFDVPGGPPDDPDAIYRATLNAFAAGAHGIVVSREYEEMEIPHLRAVGRAVREVMRATRGTPRFSAPG